MTSPLLDHCPPSLPAAAYRDAAWFDRERAAIWRRDWVAAGLVADFPDDSIRRVDLGGAPVIVVTTDGTRRAFHNVCRHRGAELCAADSPLARLITCPYHAWAYAPDGRLLSTGFGTPTADFQRADHGLLPVHLIEWNGILFLSAANDRPDFKTDVGLDTLDNWPMASLQRGHRSETRIRSNWKVFWENYSECLHCPGVHPGLVDRVPVYRHGVMAEAERSDGGPAEPALKPGTSSWTTDGTLCGPAFPGLTDSEMGEGYRFVTIWPSAYVVAHADHVRVVRVVPVSPDETVLIADWLFSGETLGQPGFDAGAVAQFAMQVMSEDGAACEMNQRGLASPSFTGGRLMPQEYEVHAFQRWVGARLGLTEKEASE